MLRNTVAPSNTARQPRPQRVALAAVLLLCVAFVGAVWSAGAQKSETIDEGLFIMGGVAQVRDLQPNIDLTHPPLLRWVAGLPAVWIAKAQPLRPVPVIPAGEVSLLSYFGDSRAVFNYTADAFYLATHNHDRVLFWGRAGFAVMGALLGVLVWVALRSLVDPWVAVLAAAVTLTIPEVLAHSQWAHSDVASALSLLAVALALHRLLAEPSVRAAALTGALLGVAVMMKFTALVLWPWVLAITAWSARADWRGWMWRTGAAMLACYAVIVMSYLPDPRLLPHRFAAADLAALHLTPIAALLEWIPLPDAFLKGVLFTAILGGQKIHIAYFAGEVSTDGWLAYFPAALLLKYPTGLLLMAAAGLVVLWRGAFSRAQRLAFTVVPIALFLAAMGQTVNIGARSILPVAPFLAIWSAVAVHAAQRTWLRVVALALLATSMFSGVRAYPDFLAWFNPLAGGTKAASDWFVDSNYDWGQDLPALAAELRRRNIAQVRLAYFGAARPAYYGINALDATVRTTGWYAISRSYLTGWWPPGDRYGWLRSLEPVTLVGGSIALFYVSAEDLARSNASSN